jgi:hypothetical protein
MARTAVCVFLETIERDVEGEHGAVAVGGEEGLALGSVVFCNKRVYHFQAAGVRQTVAEVLCEEGLDFGRPRLILEPL